MTAVKAAGWLLITLALGDALAWWSGDPVFLQFFSPLAPLHLNAAGGFFAWGIGFLALTQGWNRLVHLIGAGLIILGVMLLGHFYGVLSFGIDDWVMLAHPTASLFPRGGVNPPLAVSFCIAGFVLLVMTRRVVISGMSIVLAIAGATLVTGSIATIISASVGSVASMQMVPPFLGLLGVIIGGSGFIAFALRPGLSPRPVGYGLPLLVGFTGIVFTLVLWQALNDQQSQRLFRQVQFETAHLDRLLDEHLRARVQRLTDLAESWERTSEARRKEEVGTLIALQPGYFGLAHLNADQGIEWVEAIHRQHLPDNLEAFGVAESLASAIEQGKVTVVRAPRSCWQGTRMLIIYAPHRSGDATAGGMLGILKIHEVIDTILNANVAAGYAIALADKEETIYGRASNERRYQTPWQQTLTVHFRGFRWQLHVWPTPDVMARESLSLPKLSLIIGFLTTILLALAVHLAQTARWRARDLEREMQERRFAENALKQSEEKYRLLIESLEQGIYLKDCDGRYVAVNPWYCQDIGRTEAEVIGRTDSELFNPDEAARWAQEERKVCNDLSKVESEQEREIGGKKRIIRRVLTPMKGASGTAAGVLGICWDVTDQRLIENRLRQAGKMDAIGQLAGGIAHDFNNLLTAILGNLDLVLRGMKPGERQIELVLAAQSAATRAASLTGRLLGFSREHHIDWEPTNLNAVVLEVVSLLGRTIDPRIRIETRIGTDLWPVKADEGQINQVLMNLCINARDAIKSVGKITIETADVVLDNLESHQSADARAGEFVRLRVSDTGSGMTPEVRARIFEPFFTTKEVGKGTGLGLAMVFAIVRKHQGWIECQSGPDHGTQFDIYLPRTQEAVKSTPNLSLTPLPPHRGNETILLADDEPMIRRLAKLVLETKGYTVLEAEDGQQAVDIYEREQKRIDLVLLDLTMPNLSGQEAFRQILAINRHAKVLFASGYAAEQITELEQQRIVGFVKKPYRPDELVQAIQDSLRKSTKRRAPPVGIAT